MGVHQNKSCPGGGMEANQIILIESPQNMFYI